MKTKQLELQNRVNTLNETRDKLNAEIRQAQSELADFLKTHGDLILADELQKRREEFANRIIPEKTEADRKWFSDLQSRNKSDIEDGSKFGWWEKIENGIPIPFATIFTIIDSDFIGPLEKTQFHPKATMADVVVRLGLFPSLSEARKNGRGGPLVKGEHRFKNGKFGIKRIIIQ